MKLKTLLPLLVILLLFVVGLSLFKARNNKPTETAQTKNSQLKSGNMKLTSSAFNNNQSIPAKYTCDGQNVNPPLSISDVPENAKSLVLIVDDPDAPAGSWVHWVVTNIDPKTTEIAENSVPAGAVEGKTSFGKPGYGGPCPPSGTHHYHFKLYALDIPLSLPQTATKSDLENAMNGHIIETAELVGLYSRK